MNSPSITEHYVVLCTFGPLRNTIFAICAGGIECEPIAQHHPAHVFSHLRSGFARAEFFTTGSAFLQWHAPLAPVWYATYSGSYCGSNVAVCLHPEPAPPSVSNFWKPTRNGSGLPPNPRNSCHMWMFDKDLSPGSRDSSRLSGASPDLDNADLNMHILCTRRSS